MADPNDTDKDRQPSSAVVLPVTCARDGHEHLVPEDAIVPGNAGRYTTVCGHRMLAAVLACPPGPPCRRCATIHHATLQARRTNRPGIWARLAARLHPTRGRRPSTEQSGSESASIPVTVVAPEPVHHNEPR